MERRKFERVPIRVTVVVVKERDENVIGEAADLSLGGMFIEGVRAAFGARVVINVCLGGDGRIILLPATVRWTRETGIGVQFVSLGAIETHAVTDAIARTAPSCTRERVSSLPAIDVDVDVDVG